MGRWRVALPLGMLTLLTGCATLTPGEGAQSALPAKARYVAMGSSFAAGSGIVPSADTPANRCGRSTLNYAHRLAEARDFTLIDVSCGGARTDHILGPWNELPPQMDAVTPDTRLVTITIGGNDVGYVGRLFATSCSEGNASAQDPQVARFCTAMRARGGGDDAARATALSVPDDAAWDGLKERLHAINSAIRARASKARIIYVTYVTLIPDGERCAAVPLSDADATIARSTAAKLADVTRAVAKADGAEVVDAATLSVGHDACAAEPWATGLVVREAMPVSSPYHPNATGMQAIADALVRQVDAN